MKKEAKKAAKKTPKKAAKPAKMLEKAPERVEVTITRKLLGKAPEEHHFVLQDGRTLKTVYELVDELETMHEDMFRHHVNEFKNDFANWIEHVFDEKTLAEEMRELQNRMDTQRALLKELVRALTQKK